jgi:hypothetical protein
MALVCDYVPHLPKKKIWFFIEDVLGTPALRPLFSKVSAVDYLEAFFLCSLKQALADALRGCELGKNESKKLVPVCDSGFGPKSKNGDPNLKGEIGEICKPVENAGELVSNGAVDEMLINFIKKGWAMTDFAEKRSDSGNAFAADFTKNLWRPLN